MAALAVGTPWLALSGGRWFEYFFNRVPFRSILPDPGRYPSFSQFAPPAIEGERAPSMSEERIRDDLPRIVEAARELLSGELAYERALEDYFAALLDVHGGDASALWSLDGVHLHYVTRPSPSRPADPRSAPTRARPGAAARCSPAASARPRPTDGALPPGG